MKLFAILSAPEFASYFGLLDWFMTTILIQAWDTILINTTKKMEAVNDYVFLWGTSIYSGFGPGLGQWVGLRDL